MSTPDSEPASLLGHPARTLRYGTAQQAGLLPEFVSQIPQAAAAGMQVQANGHPMYPGAVVLAAHNGVIVAHEAMGWALRYADDKGAELPRDQWLPMRKDTIFDLASVSKLFTSIVGMQLVESGRLDLDQTVTHYLPDFGRNGKDVITVRQLLTHISGLRPDIAFHKFPTYEQKLEAFWNDTPQAPPGTKYIYSDLNLIALGLIAERITGKPLDVLVRDGITGPLRMTDTGFNPPASEKFRIAAAEYEHLPVAQVDRGLVWGEVHDENAWAFGGVAGHAGIFSTAHDLAILAQTMLNGGTYGHARILRRETVALMLTNFNQNFVYPDQAHGLGFELDRQFYMGALATPFTAGHTGFTGTDFVIDPTTQSFSILLTNRVHPSRQWGSINQARSNVANALARSIAVHPVSGRTAWYSGMAGTVGGPLTTSLGLPLTLNGRGRLLFALWYSTEARYDTLTLESSVDNGQTWVALPFRLDGAGTAGTVNGWGHHRWHWADADLAGLTGPIQIRWRYSVDGNYVGRGIYVDAITVFDGWRLTFTDLNPSDTAKIQPSGWTPSST